YLELVERVLWPELIIIGGGVSKKSDKFLPRIDIRTELVPAELHNDAGIVGAALVAPGPVPAAHLVPAPPTDQPPST
ncbi:MAG: ROK family protein, partial [Acidimicrobiales bacterium]